MQGFWTNLSKPLHLPWERCGAPVEIRMAAMAEFHKSGAKEPFLWNCAAAARRNRKAVSSAGIIIRSFGGKGKRSFRRRRITPGFLFLDRETEHRIPEDGVWTDNLIYTIIAPDGAESEDACGA